MNLISPSKNIFHTFRQNVLGMMLQFLSIYMIVKLYGAEGNGEYAIALLLPALLTSFLSLGLPTSMVYFLSSKRIATKEARKVTFYVATPLCILGGGGAFYLIHFQPQLFNNIEISLLLWALLIFPLGLFQTLLLGIMQGKQDFLNYNRVKLVQPSLFLLLIIISFYFAETPEISLALKSYVASSFVSLVLISVLVHKMAQNEGDIKKTSYSHKIEMLKYGLKSHLSNILAFVNYKSDIFLVFYFTNSQITGVYVLAAQLSEKLWVFSQSISTVLFPRLSSIDDNLGNKEELTSFACRLTIFITLCVGIIGFMLSVPLATVIFGEEFGLVPLIILILLPGIVAMAGSRVIANDIASRGRPELNLYGSVVVVIVNIIGNLILIPLLGVLGAGIATSAAYILNLVIRVLIFNRYCNGSAICALIINKQDFRVVLRLTRALLKG